MKKISRLIAAVLSVAVVAGMATTAYAEASVTDGLYIGKIEPNGYVSGAKKFTATTKNRVYVTDELTVGLAIADYYSGSTRSENFAREYDVSSVNTFCSVSPYASTRVTAFGSHSAYHNGETEFFEYTEESYYMT